MKDRSQAWAVRTIATILLIALVCIVFGARADTVSLHCTPPTQNVDGSALTDLAGIRWLYGASPTSMIVAKDTPTCETSIDNLAVGTWYFAAKAFTANGVESMPSNIASKTITAPAPVPLTLKTSTTDAFRLNLGYANQIKVDRIGALALDMPCTAANWNGYYVLPNRMDSRIKIDAGKSRPLQVLAKCEMRP